MKIIKKLSCVILIFSMTVIAMTVGASSMSLSNKFCLYEIDQYENFLEEIPLPSKFVTYDSIKMFGEFYAFDIYNWVYPNFIDEESVYQYRLMREKTEYSDQPGELILEIDPNCGAPDISGKDFIEINDSDLFSILLTDENENEFYAEVDEALYLYTKDGIFYCLIWENSGNMFRLYNTLPDNEYAPDSIVGKLLNKNTAPEVIEMLKNYNFTGKPDEPIPPETADVSVIFPILGIISAGGFTLFAARKKKNK